MPTSVFLSRRTLLQLLASAPAASALGSSIRRGAYLVPTPELPDPDEPTPQMTAGPFYKTKSPKRASLLEDDMKGAKLVVEGRVLDTNGKPIAGAMLDFWQCDDQGHYDNSGYRLRGHQFADEHGRYKLETLYPGLYPGRTRHIHVRVQPANERVLTTQLFFPGESRNELDGIYRDRCLIKFPPGIEQKRGSFEFVLRVP